MNIAILGYGQMGREVEAIALNRGHMVASTIDPRSGKFADVNTESLKGADGAIEFNGPEGILDRIETVSAAGIPMVVGTTGWGGLEAQARDIIGKNGGALLYGSNFSVGANLFFHIVEEAASLINAFEDYDIMMMEYHHKLKTDSPSGTALTLAKKILEKNDRKQKICIDPLQRRIEDVELHVASVRGGAIPGIHTVTLDSAADSITLTHNARNRSGFAMGAVRGLEWLKDKRGVYHVDDFFRSVIG